MRAMRGELWLQYCWSFPISNSSANCATANSSANCSTYQSCRRLVVCCCVLYGVLCCTECVLLGLYSIKWKLCLLRAKQWLLRSNWLHGQPDSFAYCSAHIVTYYSPLC